MNNIQEAEEYRELKDKIFAGNIDYVIIEFFPAEECLNNEITERGIVPTRVHEASVNNVNEVLKFIAKSWDNDLRDIHDIERLDKNLKIYSINGEVELNELLDDLNS